MGEYSPQTSDIEGDLADTVRIQQIQEDITKVFQCIGYGRNIINEKRLHSRSSGVGDGWASLTPDQLEWVRTIERRCNAARDYFSKAKMILKSIDRKKGEVRTKALNDVEGLIRSAFFQVSGLEEEYKIHFP